MDDNEGLREATRDAFQSLGYSVACADSGLQVIELYREAMKSGSPFDVVFMDLTIRGGMGGQETMSHLMKIDPGVRSIVCSGYSNDPVMANYRTHGFADVLVKPYNLNQLANVVYRVLSSR
jgi:two-component system cell cycle sensor histidine kinase/response regulator CckA